MSRKPDTNHLLYHPSFEHDSCGVGFVANINGTPSHWILEKAVEAVVNLTHRGAVDADAKTGAGAGILYRSALGLTDQQLDIIKDYRLLRNQVHFPGDILEASSIRAYPRPIIEFFTSFINSEVVHVSNELIAKYKMNCRPLTPFD